MFILQHYYIRKHNSLVHFNQSAVQLNDLFVAGVFRISHAKNEMSITINCTKARLDLS